MIFLDSWVWLEYVLGGEKESKAEELIERANTANEGGLVAPTVIAEVAYRVSDVANEETADRTVRAIRDFEHVESLPLVDDLAEYAAKLRYEYYEPGERELSYADAIHLATASVHDECRALYTGDPDFADVDEIETVVL